MRFFLLSISLLGCVLSASAQKAHQSVNLDEYGFNLHSIESKLELENDALQYWIDGSGDATITYVSSPDFQRNFHHPTKGKKFDQFTVHWLKLRLKSHLISDSDWILSLGKITNIEVYVPRIDGKYEIRKAGQFVPNSLKDVKTGRYNYVNIFLPAQSEKTIYIKFENKIDFPPDPNIKLLHKAEWQEQMILGNLAQGFFQGLLWMMLLYNLLLFFTIGDKSYLFYVLYILFTSVYFLEFFGYWNEFVFGEFPMFNYLFLPFAIHIGFIAYLHFMRYFLQTPIIMPRWDEFLRGISFLFVVLCGFLLTLAVLSYEQYMLMERYFNLIIEITLLILLVFIFTFGDLSARYFAIGTACMLIGGMTLLMGALGFYDLPGKIYFFQGGIVLQVLIFSFALSERYKLSEREKHIAQQKLIDQLQENHLLYNKVQSELEDKVQERTSEISAQKSEIETQHAQIEAQHREITRQKQVLEHQNKQVTDSINYASRIQKAMLDSYNQIEKQFKDGFIFYRPKDIVSGDFYWYAEVQSIVPTERTVSKLVSSYGGHVSSAGASATETSSVLSTLKIVITADCTGHGVPGAFMTVMGNAILNEIINESRITEPDKILYELDKKVIATLRKQGADKQLQDGMDISVMVYDEENKKLSVSCAKNSIYYVRDFEIHTIEAVKCPIGYSARYQQKIFEKHVMYVKEDDVFYMASDGFGDQFGGKDGRKYMKKRLREYFLKISHLPLWAQKEKLEAEFDEWKGYQSQTDDVVIVGIKF
jgi:two-component system, sensor histidine kinase LadS